MTFLVTTQDLTTNDRGGFKRALATGARWLASIMIVAVVGGLLQGVGGVAGSS